ncbi:MAG: site-2 protease family protein [Dehalococcoidia bacterium]|nr:site-2 protease family protein [Dehalococcoidia bacterium]
MFRGGIPIGRAFGISLRLHYSWFLIFVLVTWALATAYFPTTYPTWSLSLKIGAGIITSILFFGSVLVHELMHSLVAIRQGIQIRSITLFFLGGVSEMSGEPKTAGDEFRMAAAGPFSSLILGGLFLGIYFALRGAISEAAQFGAAISFYLGLINIMLGVFNLIPGFPLDGGRVLRSLIWWRSRNLQRATKIASTIGRVIGFLFIVGGIWLALTGNFFNGLWLVLIGWFLESAASGSYRQMLVQDMLKGHTASEVMTRDCVVIPPDITVERLVNEHILSSGRRCFPVVSESHTEGLMTLSHVKSIPRDARKTTLVREAMTPLSQVKSVSPNEDLANILQILSENDINQVPVIWENKVVGIVARDNLINFINTRNELQRG